VSSHDFPTLNTLCNPLFNSIFLEKIKTKDFRFFIITLQPLELSFFKSITKL